jgi:DNA-directed RNA polymerase subunit RPC12/RpoP
MSFLIVVCERCGGLLLAKDEQKTRTCPYCGSKVAIQKAKKVASTKTALEASTILRKLKQESALKQKTANRPQQS